MSIDHTDCPACHGTGQFIVMRPIRRYEKIEPLFCSECGGTGKKPEKTKPKPVRIISRLARARRTRRGV
jgi:DnaJ-class molecular chaperone